MIPRHLPLPIPPASLRARSASRLFRALCDLRDLCVCPCSLPKNPSFVFIRLRTLSFSVSCNPFVCHSYENNRGGYQQFPKWNIPAPAGTPFWLTSPTSSCTAIAPLTAKRSPMTLTPKKTRLRVPGSKSSPTSHAPTARKMTWWRRHDQRPTSGASPDSCREASSFRTSAARRDLSSEPDAPTPAARTPRSA